MVSIDGTTGEVFAGAVPVTDVGRRPPPRGHAVEQPDDLVDAVAFVLDRADAVRRLEVRANADTPDDAARARRFGARGIGLCRTEHMFLGERRELVERLILAEDEAGREAALADLLPLQRADFTEILEQMDGLPVTIRLIDPPLHEFLPDQTDLAVQVALEDDHGHRDRQHHRLLEAVGRLHEQNPMLGLRGVRLGIAVPGLFTMQARAVLEAAADRVEAGGDPRPEIMIPLVATATELEAGAPRDRGGRGARSRPSAASRIPVLIGTMIEVPRAALTADRIAAGRGLLLLRHQRPDPDDVGLLPRRRRGGVLPDLPRPRGLRGLAVRVHRRRRGRVAGADRGPARSRDPARPAPRVCGEHGGDPDSIHFFEQVGLDYVSCSPFRVPVARLEAARAVLL